MCNPANIDILPWARLFFDWKLQKCLQRCVNKQRRQFLCRIRRKKKKATGHEKKKKKQTVNLSALYALYWVLWYECVHVCIKDTNCVYVMSGVFVTSTGERPLLMRIMSGMLLICAHSLETIMVRIVLILLTCSSHFGKNTGGKNQSTVLKQHKMMRLRARGEVIQPCRFLWRVWSRNCNWGNTPQGWGIIFGIVGISWSFRLILYGDGVEEQ